MLGVRGGACSSGAALHELEVELGEEALLLLERAVMRPSFLHALESAASSFMPKGAARGAKCGSSSEPQAATHNKQQQQEAEERAAASPAPEASSDDQLSSASSATALPEEQHPLASGDDEWDHVPSAAAHVHEADSEGFVAVQRDDVMQAMAYHIAQLIATHPESQNMSPKELQEALSGAFSALKQTRFRQVCHVGRMVYRWSTLGWSALQMYRNPWLIQAVLTALWTFSRLGARAFMP